MINRLKTPELELEFRLGSFFIFIFLFCQIIYLFLQQSTFRPFTPVILRLLNISILRVHGTPEFPSLQTFSIVTFPYAFLQNLFVDNYRKTDFNLIKEIRSTSHRQIHTTVGTICQINTSTETASPMSIMTSYSSVERHPVTHLALIICTVVIESLKGCVCSVLRHALIKNFR